MTPIKPGTARRLELKPVERLQPSRIFTVGEMTNEQMIDFRRAFIEAVTTQRTTVLEQPAAPL